MVKDFQNDEYIYKKYLPKFRLFNYKIFALIIVLAVAYQAYILTYDDTPGLDFPEYVFIFGAVICGILSVLVAMHYTFHETFRTSYIALGINFFLYAIGEITYVIHYHVFQIDAFPSMADVFFLSTLFFAFIHLFLNINYFKNKISNKLKIVLVTLGISILIPYAILSLDRIGVVNLDFFVGMLYALKYSVLVPLAILGMVVVRKTLFGHVWLLLVTGLFFFGLGEVWWIYLEFFEGFTYRHPVNTLWIFGFMVISFSLIEHLRVSLIKK